MTAHTAHQRLPSCQVSAVHNQTAAKARSHAPTIAASPLAIINSISRLRFLFRSISSPALKGSSGLTKKAARLCTQSGAHFLLEATMGGMPPYERSVPVAGRASLLFSNEKRASLNDAPFAVRAALGAGSTHRERRQIANTQCNLQAERNETLRLRWMDIVARRQFVD